MFSYERGSPCTPAAGGRTRRQTPKWPLSRKYTGRVRLTRSGVNEESETLSRRIDTLHEGPDTLNERTDTLDDGPGTLNRRTDTRNDGSGTLTEREFFIDNLLVRVHHID